jgi:ribosomal protein L12E/L44/L45/RPP1/RPP2
MVKELLYCSSEGCTLHDYDISPTFCEYLWHQSNRTSQKVSEENLVKVIERVGSQIADSLSDALFEALESRNTNQTRSVANRAREIAPKPQSNKRNEGGIAI